METIQVKTGTPYDILVGKDILGECGKRIKKLPGQHYQKAAVITDETVAALYGETVEKSLRGAGFDVIQYAIPPGEASKSMERAMDIIGFLCDNYLTRTDVIVALGGGVVGDLAGFVASVYLRGVDYVQIPTTFLAAVDSSVGGKTAVNIPQGKNLVGCFWQPRLVVCDIATLSTLRPETFAEGTAEAVKYGCIWDEALFRDIASGGLRDHLQDIVARCIDIKRQVVEQDERDLALRQILNFGHTLGHGVEKLSKFQVSHGNGVAIGMCLMAAAGERAGITQPGTAEAIRELLLEQKLPVSTEIPLPQLCEACMGDKKRGGDSINLIVLERIGRCRIHPVPAKELETFIKE